jgi:hypothetical protein
MLACSGQLPGGEWRHPLQLLVVELLPIGGNPSSRDGNSSCCARQANIIIGAALFLIEL